jgi:hypothetical protein
MTHQEGGAEGKSSARIVSILTVLVGAGVAAAGNVPAGATGLWRFQNSDEKPKATFGVDLTNSSTGNSAWFSGPWTVIEPGLSDGGVVQERSWDYLTVNPSFTANGGGSYVNQYTVAITYQQTQAGAYNSLFQTSSGGTDGDGDLFIKGDGTIGIGDVGYSTQTFDSSTWHRIIWSIDNGDDTGAGGFFRVYVDGTLFLNGAGQGRDGRFSPYPDRFHLLADDSWEDMWGLVGTVATWNRALTTDEVAGMGGLVQRLCHADAAGHSGTGNAGPARPGRARHAASPPGVTTGLS